MLHAAFFILGMGLMAPLTAILQTMDYLNIFFAQYYPSRTLYTAYNTCNLIALVILFKWGDRVWPNKRSRMVTGYSLYTIILMCLPLVSAWPVLIVVENHLHISSSTLHISQSAWSAGRCCPVCDRSACLAVRTTV